MKGTRKIKGIPTNGNNANKEVVGLFHCFMKDVDGDIVAVCEEIESGKIYYLYKDIQFI